MNLAALTVQIGAQTAGFEAAILKSTQQLKVFEERADKASRPLKNFEQTANGLLVPTSALAKNLDGVGKAADRAGKEIAQAEKAAATATANMGKLSGIYAAMGAETAKLDATTERAVARLELFAATASRVAVVSAALTAGLALAGYGFIKVASDANETQNKFEVAFGTMSKEVDAWAVQTADAMGRSRFQMRNFAADAQAMLAPMVGSAEAAAEMSKGISALAVDLGSFFNVADNDALLKLKAGLVGEAEPMRAFGVDLTNASVQAWALTQGLKVNIEQMDQAGKTALRYAYIMAQTTMAQGDAVRTADSFANQSKALQGNLRNLAEEIGRELLPYANEVVGWAKVATKWFSDLDPPVKRLIVGFGAVSAAGLGLTAGLSGALALLAKLLSILPGLSVALALLKTNISLVGMALKGLGGWPGLVITGLVGIAGALWEISAGARAATQDISKMTDAAELQKYIQEQEKALKALQEAKKAEAQASPAVKQSVKIVNQQGDWATGVMNQMFPNAPKGQTLDTGKAIKETVDNIAKAKAQLKKVNAEADKEPDWLREFLAGLKGAAAATRTVADVTADMNAAISAASIKAHALGDAAGFNEAKLTAMNRALGELTKIGTPEAAKAIDALAPRIRAMEDELAATTQASEEYALKLTQYWTAVQATYDLADEMKQRRYTEAETVRWSAIQEEYDKLETVALNAEEKRWTAVQELYDKQEAATLQRYIDATQARGVALQEMYDKLEVISLRAEEKRWAAIQEIYDKQEAATKQRYTDAMLARGAALQEMYDKLEVIALRAEEKRWAAVQDIYDKQEAATQQRYLDAALSRGAALQEMYDRLEVIALRAEEKRWAAIQEIYDKQEAATKQRYTDAMLARGAALQEMYDKLEVISLNAEEKRWSAIQEILDREQAATSQRYLDAALARGAAWQQHFERIDTRQSDQAARQAMGAGRTVELAPLLAQRQIAEQFALINKQAEIYGKEFDAVAAKSAALRKAIDDLLTQGYGPENAAVQDLVKQLNDLNGAVKQSAVASFAQNAAQGVMGRFSVINGATQGAQAGMAAGPAGAIIGMFIGIIQETETFRTAIALVTRFITAEADAIGRLLEPLLPLYQILNMVMLPIFNALGVVLSNLLMPAMQLLFPALKWFGELVLKVGLSLAKFYNAFVDLVKEITFGKIQLNKIDLKPFEDALGTLAGLTWEEAMRLAQANEELSAFADQLRNAPSGFKIALARWDATAPGAPGGGASGITYPPVVPPSRPHRPGYGIEPPGPGIAALGDTYVINGDVYGWDDFKRKVAEAQSQNGRKASLGRFGLAGAGGVIS